MRAVWVLPVLLAAGFAQTPPSITREGGYWVETRSETAPFSGRLRVSSRGPVGLNGVAGNSIQYTLKKRVKASSRAEAERLLSRVAVRVRNQQNWTVIHVDYPDGITGSAELNLNVPRAMRQAAVETDFGSVGAFHLDGSIELETGGGHIQLDGIGGDVAARTGGGEIRAGKVGGSLRCLSGGGPIRADFVGGQAFFETAGGEIFIGEVGGPVEATTAGGNIHVTRAASSVSANTAGGLIDIRHAGGLVTAGTASGCITVASAKGVRLESAAGPIQLRHVSGPLRVSTVVGNIVTELLPGGRMEDSFLNTGGGDVTVYIPSNLAVTIRALSESSRSFKKIVSDFPEIRMKTEGVFGASPVIAEGMLNGGGPLLRISASGGTIYLRRQK